MNPHPPRAIHNLALIGFMGTGKSSVGRMVAEHLRFTFVDTDDLIENQVGRSVAEIFEQQGEPAFRQLEQAVVNSLCARRNIVIATGGGLVTNPDNLASLKSHALVICLWASPETIWERVRTQTHRPLLKAPDPQARIRELLAARAAAYHEADVMIHTGFRSSKEVVQQVLHQFHSARK